MLRLNKCPNQYYLTASNCADKASRNINSKKSCLIKIDCRTIQLFAKLNILFVLLESISAQKSMKNEQKMGQKRTLLFISLLRASNTRKLVDIFSVCRIFILKLFRKGKRKESRQLASAIESHSMRIKTYSKNFSSKNNLKIFWWNLNLAHHAIHAFCFPYKFTIDSFCLYIKFFFSLLLILVLSRSL